MQEVEKPRSVIVDTGVYAGDCGYCNGHNCSTSHGEFTPGHS